MYEARNRESKAVTATRSMQACEREHLARKETDGNIAAQVGAKGMLFRAAEHGTGSAEYPKREMRHTPMTPTKGKSWYADRCIQIVSLAHIFRHNLTRVPSACLDGTRPA